MGEEKRSIWTENLHYRYGAGEGTGVLALGGVFVEIRQGEFVVVIGPNGSGKSTLAKHFNALLLPSEGDVLVLGMNTKDPEFTWEIRKGAGMVFQNPDNQIVATVVEEDVAFGPENLGVEPSDIRRRVTDSLGKVGMLSYRRHAPHLLSGGQKQRVAIAGILAMSPSCIILDEPTAMLDPRGRQEVMEAVDELNKKYGITVVHITHYMDEVLYGDRVLVMAGGKVVLEGPPKEVFGKRQELRALGLDVPPLGGVIELLNEGGLDVRPDALRAEELVDELCRLKSKT